MPGVRVADPKACQCGEVLKGVIKPWECKVFGTACTPETPIGTCMVSSEGACAAYYNFGRLHREVAVTLAGDDRHTPGVPSAHGLPRQGRATGTRARTARPEHDPAGHRHRARRRQVVGLPVGPRRPVHAFEASHRPADAVRIPPTRRSSRQIAALNVEGRRRVGTLERRRLPRRWRRAYAGEGRRRDGAVNFANTDAAMVRFFCAWLRRFFESTRRGSACGSTCTKARPRRRRAHWSAVTGIPRSQFRSRIAPCADPSIRLHQARFGCVYVCYSCSTTHRRIMGLIRALLSSDAIPG